MKKLLTALVLCASLTTVAAFAHDNAACKADQDNLCPGKKGKAMHKCMKAADQDKISQECKDAMATHKAKHEAEEKKEADQKAPDAAK